ncbi:MAG: ABC transporter permease [Proteobacteria bacterium]|nr:ABC transporter permease [Pseudomonadota bacterium]
MFEYFVGLRYLLNRARVSLSIISVISILGVCLGVMALVSVISVASGFEDVFRDKVLGVNSHVLVMTYKQDDFREYRDVQKTLEEFSPEILETAPFIFHEMMIAIGSKVSGILIKGVEPETMMGVSDLAKYIIADDDDARAELLKELHYLPARDGEVPPVIIGRVLAEKLKAGIGDEVRVISPRRGIVGEHRYGPSQMEPTQKRFRIIALYDSGFYDYDNRLLICDYKALQDFFNLDDVVTGVEVRVKDITKTGELRDAVTPILNTNPAIDRFKVIDWQDLNRNLFTSLHLQKITLTIIMLFIVIVASFNIVGTLIMMVLDKQRDISIMKSMGASDGMIMRSFIYQGMFIGGMGTVLGLIGGLIACELLSLYDFELDSTVYLIGTLPVKLEFSVFCGVGLATLFISFLATLYPSWWATQMSPIEGLRYE